MTISEVIKKIEEFHQPYTAGPKTRDLVLYGDPEQECTGIAVTATATLEVLHKAVEEGINFIVSHEGITYNYEKVSDVDSVDNEVLQAKLAYMRENRLCVWRDHDHMHGGGPMMAERLRPDMIFYGTMKELGWEKYVSGDTKKPLMYKIPTKSAEELADEIMEKWNLNGLRIVGNRNAQISTVYIVEHMLGGEMDLPKIDMAEKADAFIPLEIVDYTLTQYVRDAAYLGKNKVIFEMGHFSAEELGMKYLEKALPEHIGENLKVKYIQSGDTFSYMLRKKQ